MGLQFGNGLSRAPSLAADRRTGLVKEIMVLLSRRGLLPIWAR